MRAGQRPRQRCAKLGADRTVAGDAAAGLRLRILPHERQCQLAGEQFVIGEPLPRERTGGNVGGVGRTMQPPQCLAKSGPAPLRYPAGILPFRRVWHLVDAVTDALTEHLAGQPGSQCINRFEQRQVSAILRRYDVIGVRHLQRVVVALDTARHETDLTHRQLPLHERMISVEEYEVEAAGIVLRRDLVGGL